MPIIFDVRIDDVRQVIVAARMIQRQIEHHQVNDIFDGHVQSSQKLNSVIAIGAGKQIESVTKIVQRSSQMSRDVVRCVQFTCRRNTMDS